MKKILLQSISVSFLLLYPFLLQAQESINCSGNNGIGSGGSISYSVGQIAYTTNSGTNGAEAQGVQQPYEISVVLGIEHPEINLFMTVSPNPTTDFILLKVDNSEFEKLTYQLFDVNGKQYISNQITATETQISTRYLPTAVYFLKISDKEKVIKTFKIIKN